MIDAKNSAKITTIWRPEATTLNYDVIIDFSILVGCGLMHSKDQELSIELELDLDQNSSQFRD